MLPSTFFKHYRVHRLILDLLPEPLRKLITLNDTPVRAVGLTPLNEYGGLALLGQGQGWVRLAHYCLAALHFVWVDFVQA
jgi:hypothetical protein